MYPITINIITIANSISPIWTIFLTNKPINNPNKNAITNDITPLVEITGNIQVKAT